MATRFNYYDYLYSEKVDLWSAGIVLIMMLTGEHPFNTDDTKQLFKEIMNGEMLVECAIDQYYCQISNDAIDLVKALIKKDPRERLSAKQALEHAWIKNKLRSSETLEAAKQSLVARKDQKLSGCRNEVYER